MVNGLRKKNYVKQTADERNFSNDISTICGHPANVIKDVFMAVLIHFAINVYSGKNEFCLPYIGKIKVKTKLETTKNGFKMVEKFNIKTSPALHQILLNIQSKEDIFLMDFFVDEIREKLDDILDLDFYSDERGI